MYRVARISSIITYQKALGGRESMEYLGVTLHTVNDTPLNVDGVPYPLNVELCHNVRCLYIFS